MARILAGELGPGPGLVEVACWRGIELQPTPPPPRTSDESGVLDPLRHQGRYGEDLVRLIASAAGFSCEKPADDGDGIDLVVSRTHSNNHAVRPPKVELQVKTLRDPTFVNLGKEISYDLEVDHYNNLRGEGGTSRYLVLVRVPKSLDSGRWTGVGSDFLVFHQAVYWCDLTYEPPTSNTSKIAVRVPLSQRYDRSAVHRHMREANERLIKIFGIGGSAAE